MANALNWFEIPVSDIERASAFYASILGGKLTRQDMGEEGIMAILPYQDGVGGALVAGNHYKPSQEGSVIYLNGGENLNVALSKVEAAGGKVIADKFSIGENGFIAFFLDTEGNKVGFHSMA